MRPLVAPSLRSSRDGSQAAGLRRRATVAPANTRNSGIQPAGGQDMERKQASEYPQELLDLFHEYQHGDINRRDFFDRAAKFAVGGLTVAAILESLKPNYAWAQQVPKDDSGSRLRYETVPSPEGNGSIKGYLVARPARRQASDRARHPREPRAQSVHRGRRAPAGGLGFMAFAPDGLTSVGGYPGDDEKGAAAFRTVDGKKMTEDFVAAAKWLKARPESSGKLGAVGFCFGGGIVNQLAVRLGTDLNAGVPFYGRQPGADDVPKIKAPLAAPLRRQRPGHQRRDRGLRSGAQGQRQDLRRCTSTKARSTASTTTRPRATTSRPRSSPGSARSTSSTRPFATPRPGNVSGPARTPD